MADFLTLNALLAMSKTPQAAFGTPKVAAADFSGAVTTALNVTLPAIEKISNEGVIGGGDEWADDFINDYVTPPGMTFSDRINTEQCALAAARHLGGVVTTEEVEADEVWDHTIVFALSSADPTPKTTTLAGKFGGLDLILADMICNSLGISFSDSAPAVYNAEFIGSGKFLYMADQDPALVLPAPVAQNYLGTAAAYTVSWDNGSLQDMSSVGRAQSFSLQSSLNADTSDRRPGDGLRTSGDVESGAFVKRASRGRRSTQISVGIYNNGSKVEFLDSINNTEIENLKFKALGKIIHGVYRHELEITVPKSVIRVPALGDNKEKQLLNLTFDPKKDSAEAGLWKIRIRNAHDSLA